MTRFLSSDLLPTLLLLFIAVEAVVLVLVYRRLRRGPAPALTLTFLAAGAGFAAALLFHRRDGGTVGFAVAMCAAGVAHAWHLMLLARVSRANTE